MAKRRASEVLERALELIERRKGWIQRSLEDGEGGYCMLGAIDRSVKVEGGAHTPEFNDAVEALAEHIPAGVGRRIDTDPNNEEDMIATFNDASRRRKKDVIAVFKKAIRSAKAREGEVIDVPAPEQDEPVAESDSTPIHLMGREYV